MKIVVSFLGIIIGLVGLGLLVYSVSIYIPFIGTFVVYPYQVVGAIVLLIGFITFAIGLSIPEIETTDTSLKTQEEKRQAQLTDFSEETNIPTKLCGTCPFFNNPIMCPYKEKNANARLCEFSPLIRT